jgi:hypothetical protein
LISKATNPTKAKFPTTPKTAYFSKLNLFILNLVGSVKQKIKSELTELEGLYEKRSKLELKKNSELLPHQVAFNDASKAIDEKFAPKFAPVNKKITELEKSIGADYSNNRKPDGSFKLGNIESDKLIAEIYSTQSSREVDPQTFFNSVPEADKSKIWGSLKVLIGNAEKLLGTEKLNKIAKVTTTWNFRIRRK